MHASLALLPSAVVLVAVLGLRWSGLAAAAAAMLSSALLWALGLFTAATAGQAANALADAGVLTLLVAATTLPGILFVEATRGQNAPGAIAGVIQSLRLGHGEAAILVAIGFGVLIESLTGMGVSLLVTIPVLMRMADRPTAIALGLVGMSLMPWGALAISAHVGAKLSALPIEVLSDAVTWTSGAVAATLPLWAVAITRSRAPRDYLAALVAGAALFIAAALASRFVGIEVAGVLGGLCVILVMTLFARNRDGLGEALAAPGLRPYLCLIAVVMLQKLAVGLLAARGLSLTLATDRVSFSVLTSPGIALMIATLVTSWRVVDGGILRAVARRSWRPTVSIALFMLAARLLIECGAIAALAGLLGGLGRAGSVVAVVLLGAVSGFATGSGVTGNALFMPSAAAIGATFGQVPLLAALQNGAAGHAAIVALPIAALLLSALPSREPGDDRYVMRVGLVLTASHVAVLVAVGLWQLRVL